MKCVFERRGTNTVTLRDLFSNVNVIVAVGNNSTTSARAYINGSYIIAVTNTAYILSWRGSSSSANLSVWKVTGGVVSSTPIIQMSTTYGGIAVNTSNHNVYNYNGSYTSSSSTTGSSNFGGIALVEFPDYTPATIESVITSATKTSLAVNISGQSNTTGTARITISDAITHELIFTYKGNAIDFWVPDGNGSVEKIGGTATNAFSANSTYLTSASCYIAGMVGFN